MQSSIQTSAPELAIRRLAEADAVQAVGLARAFHAASAYSHLKLSLAKVDAIVEAAIHDPDRFCTVLVTVQDDALVGYLMAVVHEHYFSQALTCSDLGFWIEPAHRTPFAARTMILELERWAFGVKRVNDISLGVSSGIADAGILRFYERMGYTRGFSGVIKSRQTTGLSSRG